MLKIFGLIVVLVVVGLVVVGVGGDTVMISNGFGSNTAVAPHQTQEWKTFYKPNHFSMDYPIFTGKPAQITTDSSDISDITTQDPSEMVKQILNMDLVHSHTEIKSQPIVISISSTYLGMDTLNSDPQEEAVKQKLDLIQKHPDTVINQDIFTSVYDDKVGYTFVIHNPTSYTIESVTFVETYDYIYNIHISGMAYNPNTTDDINKILNSIKFFN